MSVENESPPRAVTPEQFLDRVSAAEPGWSDSFGGPAGVVGVCAELQQQLMAQSEQIAAVRVAAVRELLRGRTGREVAAMLGVSSAAVSKANHAAAWAGATW